MRCINLIGRSALGALSLSFLAGPALAQENAGAAERFSVDARGGDLPQEGMRDAISGGGQLLRSARSGMLDWGTGGFELTGERLKWGSKLIGSVPMGSQWRRTYAAEMRFRETTAPGIVLEAGARLERTRSGVHGGPLLTDPTTWSAKMAYVGAQTSGASIRLLGFDNGGWADGVTEGLVRRIANGEPAARRGTAIEIGTSESHAGQGRREPHFKLRLERGRTAAISEISATIFWKARF